MATPPKEATAAPVSSQLFGNCWSCRILSGGGLLLSAGYVFLAARKTMRQGGTTRVGTVFQIAVAASLASWGIVVLADPVGKAQRKT